MTSLTRSIALSVGAVLLFDLLASLASRAFGFPYARAAMGSYILFVAIGYLTARNAIDSPVQTAILVAAIAGLADASLGWALSWLLGVGQLPHGLTLTPARWVRIAAIVVLLSAALGAVGGLIGRRPPFSWLAWHGRD